jgi:hypothetical protein
MKKFLFALILVYVFAFPTVSSAQDFGVHSAISGAAIAQPQAETVEDYRRYFGVGIALGTGIPDFLNFTLMLNFNETFALKAALGIINSVQLEYRLPSDGQTVYGLVGGVVLLDNYNRLFRNSSNNNFGLELGLTAFFWGPGRKDRIPVVLAGGGFGTVTLVTDFEGVILRMVFGFMIGTFFQ